MVQLETMIEGNQALTRATCMTPHTVGSVREGETALTIRDADGFAMGDDIVIRGAGPEGGPLFTTIAAITGHQVTLADAASATVSREIVGKLTDPGTVTFTDRHRDDPPFVYTDADPEVSNPSVGIWELRRINDEGDWNVHFQGTTPCHCAADNDYRVKRARALA